MTATKKKMRRRWSKRVEIFQLPSRRSAGKIKSRRANLEVVTGKPRRWTDGAIGAFRGDEAFGSSSWRNLTCVDGQRAVGSTRQIQLDTILPDDAIVVDCYQPHLSWVERVFNQIYRFKSQMVVELVLHEACMLAYVSEDFSFSDPGREAWIAVPFSVAKLAQTTAIRTA